MIVVRFVRQGGMIVVRFVRQGGKNRVFKAEHGGVGSKGTETDGRWG